MKSTTKPRPISTPLHPVFPAAATATPYPCADVSLPSSPLSITSPGRPSSPAAGWSSRSFSFPFPITLARRSSTHDSRIDSRSKPAMPQPPRSASAHPTSAAQFAPAGPRPSLQRTATEPFAPTFINSPPASPTTSANRSYLQKTKRTNTTGTISHCGRHGNDWLFGGYSVRETVRRLLRDEEGK